MSKLSKILGFRSTSLHTFHGGVKTLPHRKAMSNQTAVRVAPIPKKVTIPLQPSFGNPVTCIVNVGDRVLKGQLIGQAKGILCTPVHAPTSGHVIAIGKQPIPSPNNAQEKSIVIETDGLDEWVKLPEPQDYRTLNSEEIQEKIRAAGVVGLGGAGFPCHAKMTCKNPVDMLIINGAECEPYITCDDMLMRTKPNEIISGIEILMHGLHTSKCMIGIEDNKPEAIEILRRAIEQKNIGEKIQVVVTPTIYPTGSEKQLIEILTGKQVPQGGLPIDIGYVVQNVATAAATYEAIAFDRPFISRLVTVTGKGVKNPGNVDVLLGTSLREIVEFCGGFASTPDRMIAGGPMMGTTLISDDVPLLKRINSILIGAPGELAPEQDSLPCIRCGACANACPISLLPQQMFWHCQSENFDEAANHNILDCIECGCCSFVCPSKIPLVQAFKYGKFKIRAQREDEKRAETAQIRSARKIERTEQANREAKARKEKALAMAAQKKLEQQKATEVDAAAKTDNTSQPSSNDLPKD